MRKITEKVSDAFLNKQSVCMSNSAVVAADDKVSLYLHSNLIARLSDDKLEVTLAGWGTPTTRERLNGLMRTLRLNVRFNQYKGDQYMRTASAGRRIEVDETICLDLNGNEIK